MTSSSASSVCAWCQMPRASGPKCQHCGAIHAKAEQLRTHGKVTTDANDLAFETVKLVKTPELLEVPELVEDWALEFKICIAAIPSNLLLAVLFNVVGQPLQRIFFSMPIHELGHAIAGWFCGFASIPTVWWTWTPAARGFLAPCLLFFGLAWMIHRARLARLHALVGLLGLLLLLQLYGTFGIKHRTAQMVITFSGDGLGMVLGTALICSFFFGKSTQLYRGWLRWGFVAIGAAAYVDMFGQWIAARRDFDQLPLGEQNGELSDATKLLDVYGWTEVQLIARHIGVGALCLTVLAAVYVWGVRSAWLEAKKRKKIRIT